MHEPTPGNSNGASRLDARACAAGKCILAKCEAWAQQSPAVAAVLLTAALFALVFAIFTPGFQTNDDPQLAMIAAGKGIALAPDEHLVFTNVVIGQVLKALYTACPVLPWYGVYLIAAQYLAQVVLAYCSLVRGYSRWRTALYLLFFVAIGIFYLNNLQFTTTACLVGQSGLIATVTALRWPEIGARRVRLLLSAGVALLTLASLIRLESFLLTALAGTPVVAAALWRPSERRTIARAIAASCVCCGLVLACTAYNDAYYRRDPQWEAFLRYNKLRIKFNDYGWTRYTAETAGIFAAAQWSENDHAMIQDWFYDEPVLYSYTRLQSILTAYPWRSSRLTAAYAVSCARPLWRDKSLWPAVLILPLVMWSSQRARRDWLALWGTLVAVVSLLAVIAVCNKAPPSRVYFPALTFVVLPLLVAARQQPPWPHRRWPALAVRTFCTPRIWSRPGARALLRPSLVHAAVLLAIVGSGMAASRQHRVSNKTVRERRTVNQCLAALPAADRQLYVAWATDFPFEAISPLDNMQSLSQCRLLMVSWPQGTPIAAAMKRHFDIDNLAQSLATDPRIQLLGDATSQALLARFLAEHGGRQVRFVPTHDGRHAYDVVSRLECCAGFPAATTAQQPSPLPLRPGQLR